MTKDDALRMMLGPFKAWRDAPGNEDVVEELTKIINAAEQALAQPAQPAQPAQRTEQNFCPRCGKRTKDIHTCTPPKENT